MSLTVWPEPLRDELQVLRACVPLQAQHIIELGCGAAHLARQLLVQHPGCQVVGLEVDERQQAKNLAQPQAGLQFVTAGAQAIPFADARFDLALMLKSLHHVPLASMDTALSEVARVLRPEAWLYVSEPVYDGPLNQIVRLYNDEGTVRAAAQAALDRALATADWVAEVVHRFETPVRFASFEDFEQRMMRPTFADHALDEAKIAQVRAAYLPHQGPDGAAFTRPMHVRCLQRR